jgi:hypothetical protein
VIWMTNKRSVYSIDKDTVPLQAHNIITIAKIRLACQEKLQCKAWPACHQAFVCVESQLTKYALAFRMYT